MGSTVLLLEADLRRPVIAEKLDLAPGPGLSDVLVGSVPLWRAIQWLALELDVLVAGTAVPPNPGELIESDAMEALLEQVGSTYDLVVVDTPPLAVLSDAFPLLRKVDGVVVVGWVGRNRRDVAERLHETLIGAGAPLLGVIANRCRAGRFTSQPYGYAYARDEPSAGVTTSSLDGADSYTSSAPGEIGASSDPDFWVEPSTSDRPGGGVGSPNGHEAEPLGRLQQE
jgi:succinoglycan biosynthesis transport protein ExoP